MRLAFDVSLMRPGGTLVQMALGGTPGIASAFPELVWLLAPTPDMRLYNLGQDQLDSLVHGARIRERNRARYEETA